MRLIILMLCFARLALCSGDAMFGLTWGMTPKQVKSIVDIEKKKATDNMYYYTCSKLQKNVSIAESYTLLFDEDSSLVKIVMVSVTIKNDIYGSAGKDQFDNLVNLLKQKYKVENTYCYVGQELYKESDEFYECLNYDGCGNWAILMSSENKNISIQLCGLSRGEGYIRLVAEAKPEFSNALEKNKAKKNLKDSDAF